MGYMFRLFISHPQDHFCQLGHKMLTYMVKSKGKVIPITGLCGLEGG